MAPSIMETEPVALAPLSLKKTEITNASSKSSTHEEYQYLDLIREILETGEHRPDR
jgi:thymidylate synthase